MVFEKLGFKTNFVNQIKRLLCNQEPCIINSGSTTKYFNFKKGAPHGDPTSVYLSINSLEVPFIFYLENSNIKGIIYFDAFLYTACAEDSVSNYSLLYLDLN